MSYLVLFPDHLVHNEFIYGSIVLHGMPLAICPFLTICYGLIPWALMVSNHACMYNSPFMPTIHMVFFVGKLLDGLSCQSVGVSDNADIMIIY